MASLSTGQTANHRATAAEYRRMAYLSNGWDKCKRWDGRTAALETAGIEGPSADLDSWTPSPTQAAGACEIGVHVFRYRYLDSKTGYVSNPSEEREVEVTSTNGQLTFAINTATATNIIRSTDTKVDRIVIEMTVLGGSDFFKAAEGLNSASTIVVSISDAELETQFLAWDDDGHDVPPVAKYIVSHRDRLWLFGQVTHSTGTATFTNSDVDVDEGSTDPDWRATALGDSTATPATYPSVAWFIQKDGDAAVYEIDTYDESLSKIILKSAYQGTTASNASYQIFSRANVIWLSRPGYPESFEPLKFLNGPNNEMAGDITAGVGYGSSMLFYSLSSCFKLAWDQDPLIDPVIVPLSNKYGALNQRVVVEVEGRVYAMDRLGWTVWEGVFPRMISRPVDALRSLIDYDQADRFHAVFFPGLRAIRWFVQYTGTGLEHARPITSSTSRPLRFYTSDDTIRDVTIGAPHSFIDDGYKVGMTLTIPEGFTNSGTYTVTAVTATEISVAENLTDEGPITSPLLIMTASGTPAGGVYPHNYIQYDVDTQQWSTGETYQGIAESRLVPTATGPRVLYGDENGHTWFADVGTCDGCDEDDSHLTVASGSSASVVTVDETLPTTGVGLAGCYLVWLTGATREYRLISSNTSSAITVAVPFSSAPVDGNFLWVGPIPSLLKTKAYAARGTRKKKIRPRRLTVEFTPESSARYVEIRAYDDLSDTVKTVASGTRNNLQGVVWPGNGPNGYPANTFLGDLSETDGQWDIPVGSEYRRYVEVELECEEPDATVEIVTLELDGSNLEDTRS